MAICFLPTRHWSKRGRNDTNRRLWGAFTIQSAVHTLYFGGDSGYGPHYAETAKLFPDIHVAMLGVGAYKPAWFMAPNHMSPVEAVKACNELKAKVMVPMHYATFDLSDEPPGEAASTLTTQKSLGVLKANLNRLSPGEVFYLFRPTDEVL